MPTAVGDKTDPGTAWSTGCSSEPTARSRWHSAVAVVAADDADGVVLVANALLAADAANETVVADEADVVAILAVATLHIAVAY